MQATHRGNQATASEGRKRNDAVKPVHLRFDVFDAKCSERDHTSYADRAEFFDLDAKTIWRLSHHKAEATVSTAMHIAERLGCDLPELFAVDAKSARDLTSVKAA